MKLANAAKRFDKLKLYDAYSGDFACAAQLDVFDDSRRDAYGVERRILSVAPGVTMPARRALLEPILNEVWIVGAGMPDYFNAEHIRHKHVVHRADALGTLRTPEQTLAGTGGVSAYVNAAWVKDAKQLEESSNAPGMYSVFVAKGEPVSANSVVTAEGLLLWVRGVYETAGDFTVAEAEDITGALATVSYETQQYNAKLDTTAPVTLAVQALTLRWQALYENSSDAAVRVERGDRVCVVRKLDVAAPKAGDIVRGKYPWRVHNIEDRGGVWALQVRIA